MNFIRKIILTALVVLLCLVYWLYLNLEKQGLTADEWQKFELAHVVFDEHGIPTVTAKNWQDLIEAQGFIHASERLFQMDLIRRASAGRLAELFGEKALEHDIKRTKLGILEVAQQAVDGMQPEEKRFCSYYSNGVNRFINEYKNRWGFEYFILRHAPKRWTCHDTLLVLLQMADDLSGFGERQAYQAWWAKHLPSEWADFLFNQNHPWSKPLFGQNQDPIPEVPNELALASDSISSEEVETALKMAKKLHPKTVSLGSNNWAYRTRTNLLLANDPHLAYSVPAIWYAQRLEITETNERLAGVSIPGIPAIVIGMNRNLAWAFTNTGEDIDDLIEENIDRETKTYKDTDENGKSVTLPLVVKIRQIPVKGKKIPHEVECFYTKRGPVVGVRGLEGDYSRQWLALDPSVLTTPSVDINRSRNLGEFSRKIEQMRIPSQNVVVVDRRGNGLYQNSGLGIKRATYKRFSAKPRDNVWDGYASQSTRRRRGWQEVDDQISHIVTANQRIWTDEVAHYWFGEDRPARIRQLLESSDALSVDDMKAIQLDNTSRFRKILLEWLVANYKGPEPLESLKRNLKKFNGDSKQDPKLFFMAGRAEAVMFALLTQRIVERFIGFEKELVPFYSPVKRGWLLQLMQSTNRFRVFGLEDGELATAVLDQALQSGSINQFDVNVRSPQHPFYSVVPVLGRLFYVPEVKQWGAYDTITAEQIKWGPSFRVVWDLRSPENSKWSFPLGQSGHVNSVHYRDLQKIWQKGEYFKVFPSSYSF